MSSSARISSALRTKVVIQSSGPAKDAFDAYKEGEISKEALINVITATLLDVLGLRGT